MQTKKIIVGMLVKNKVLESPNGDLTNIFILVMTLFVNCTCYSSNIVCGFVMLTLASGCIRHDEDITVQ